MLAWMLYLIINHHAWTSSFAEMTSHDPKNLATLSSFPFLFSNFAYVFMELLISLRNVILIFFHGNKKRLTASPVETEETQVLLFLPARKWWLEREVLNDDSFMDPLRRSFFDIRIRNLKQGTALWMVFLKENVRRKKSQTCQTEDTALKFMWWKYRLFPAPQHSFCSDEGGLKDYMQTAWYS